MRILQVHNRYRQKGGEDRVADLEAETLLAAGHDVRRVLVENPQGWRAAHALARSAWNTKSQESIRQQAVVFDPEVVHFHNTWFALSAAAVVGARTQAPTVMTLHNFRMVCANGQFFRDGAPCTLCAGGSKFNAVVHSCYRGHAASAVAAGGISWHQRHQTWQKAVSLFLVLSDVGRDYAVDLGIDPTRVFKKPNFVDDPGDRKSQPSESDTVLFVGRLSTEKGIDRLIEAWRRLQPTDLQLQIVGSGPLAPEESSLPSGVTYLGTLGNAAVRERMLCARALVFPSRWFEMQPMTILEAFSCGLPVMGSDLGGTAELLSPIGSEWLVPQEDRDAWVIALERLGEMDVDRASGVVRSSYLEQFTPEAGLTGLLAAYERAVELAGG